MEEIVNLRRVKKQRARAQAAQKAAENRVRFGRSKPARENDARAAARADATAEGALLEKDKT